MRRPSCQSSYEPSRPVAQAGVVGEADATYLAEHAGVELGLVEEVDSNFTGDDAGITGISLPEELAIGTFFLGRQVEARSS